MFRNHDTPEVKRTWLQDAVNALTPPQTLTERNWVQLMLADRFSIQFRVQKVDAMAEVAKVYGEKFPQS